MLSLSKDGDDEGEKDKEKEIEDWTQIIMMLKRVGSFSLKEIKKMTYPFFKTILGKLYDDKTYSITRPYMGSYDKEEVEENVLESQEEIARAIAMMNSQW